MNNNLFNDLIENVKKQNLHVLNVVIRQNGVVMGEHNFAAPKPQLLWSVSKTFTAMAIGIAESEGYFKLTDKIMDIFKDEVVEANENTEQMTIHHLLSMGTGHGRCPMDEVIRNNGPYDNISELFFKEPVIYKPGTHFVYNNAATYMLSKLITKCTGLSLRDYLMPRIFSPLEIDKPFWEQDVHGISFGCNGLYLTASDLSKFGELLLSKGKWKDVQLIPEEFIKKATTLQIDTSQFSEYFATQDHKSGYGYQIWLNSYPNSYRMDGMFGQYVVMLPDKNAVVTYVSNEPVNMTGVLELTWNTLVDKL